ncbi:MAG: hypothetical protein DYG89_30020 [Caldilinea sp. CFX5]|nr:hypothetical protein [Caldilinea sp. CFX5]
MSTYDPKQVLADYANGKITPEMAVGHSLQHIVILHDAQHAAAAGQRAEQTKLNALIERVNIHQAAIDRLLTFTAKVLAKSKPKLPGQAKPDQS